MTRYEPVGPRHTWKIVKGDIPRFKRDMKAICDEAVTNGANFAKLIPASKVAVDERVTLKCQIPFCECYGKCLMDPPYSPTAEETMKVVEKYKYAILTEVSSKVPKGYWELIQQEDMPLCRLQYEDAAI